MVLYLQRFSFFCCCCCYFHQFISNTYKNNECMFVFDKTIRKECESIYHVIERLADSKMNPIQINYSSLKGIKEARKRILNSSAKVSNELILLSPSSSSSSSHRSISTLDSWTRDLVSLYEIYHS